MPTCVVDFDNTICEWGKYPDPGLPIPGVKKALQELKNMGFEILILSSRTSDEMSKYPIDKEMQKRLMEEYLDEHEIPYDVVLKSDKPVAMYYIDDRALEFHGDWEEVLEKIKKDE